MDRYNRCFAEREKKIFQRIDRPNRTYFRERKEKNGSSLISSLLFYNCSLISKSHRLKEGYSHFLSNLIFLTPVFYYAFSRNFKIDAQKQT